MTDRELLDLAIAARADAYAPYSGFSVGAALLDANGRVYTGANVENASYGAACCAERVAFFKAITSGAREFTAIAVAGGRGATPDATCPPCGICRQVMAEHCKGNFEILLGDADHVGRYTLDALLPMRFEKENLN